MGIKGLMNLLREKCPQGIKQLDLKAYTGRIVACDASMAIYQFLIATQGYKSEFGLSELKDSEGNLTGHILGLFNRSIMLMEKGIRPCWVFDGKPPEAKQKTLAERKIRKEEAEANKQEAEEQGDAEKVLKYAGMSVKVSPQMTADAKELVRLLGLPVVEAPSEAEAQCSVMSKAGIVYATATEDMDCLTFGCPVLLRNFSSKDDPVVELKLDVILEGLGVTMDQFIDICILCGCDYADTIDGIGPVNAYKLILEHKNIEGVLTHIEEKNKDPKRKKKHTYDPENFDYELARKLFKTPETTEPQTVELKWTSPDYEGLKKFLVDGKGFKESRIESAMKKIESAKQKSNQARLDSFFKPKPQLSATPTGKRKNKEEDLPTKKTGNKTNTTEKNKKK